MTCSRSAWLLSVLTACALAVGCSDAASAPDSSGAAPPEESITNNQEEGVDEGGIVKAAGDHLIVLRRGRLFTVAMGDESLEPVCMVDAFAPGSRLGTWYDEMLVDGSQVVVIGYSYTIGATELGIFELSDDGCIAHRETYFLRSHDYYSTRNYASRLVDGELVFYMPHYLGYSNDMPAFRANEEDWRDIIESEEIHRPSADSEQSTLHTIVRCDLRAPRLGCRADGIVGGFARTFYVSRSAVYVWVLDYRYGGESTTDELPPAELYRLPLDGSAASGVRLWGAPTDQFSFREADNGDLHVLVRSDGYGDWMGGPEFSSGSVGLVTVPADRWPNEGLTRLSWSNYVDLPAPADHDTYARPLQNRFVGEHVLYGTGNTWWGTASTGTTLFAYRVGGEAPAQRLPLPHDIGRLESLGHGALAVGSRGGNLYFTSVSLDDAVAVVDQHVEAGASQGELRSHGFFYRPRSEDAGTMALPIRSAGEGYRHLTHGSASIAYLDVEHLDFNELGSLTASDDDLDDRCLVSCVDWYGNARPIFYRDRTFALLGYELVEGVIVEGGIDEVRRVHLMGDQTETQQLQLDEAYDEAMEANPGYTPGAWGWGYGGACSVSGVGAGSAGPLPLLLGLGLLVAVRRTRRR